MGDQLPVIACELTALTEAQRRRRAELAEILRGEVHEVTELPSGYAYHLDRDPSTVQKVDELISLERLVLEIGGGPGVREFVAAQFGIGSSLPPREEP